MTYTLDFNKKLRCSVYFKREKILNFADPYSPADLKQESKAIHSVFLAWFMFHQILTCLAPAHKLGFKSKLSAFQRPTLATIPLLIPVFTVLIIF